MPGMRGWWVVLSMLPAIAAPLEAQRAALTGSVRSGDGPVPGALIEALAGDSVRARTEASDEGRFRLMLPSPGTYALHVRSIGYAERRLDEVEVPASGASLELSLDALPYQLNTVVVTALRRTEKALDAPPR